MSGLRALFRNKWIDSMFDGLKSKTYRFTKVRKVYDNVHVVLKATQGTRTRKSRFVCGGHGSCMHSLYEQV